MEKNSTTPGFFVKKEWGKLFERLSNEEIGLIIKNMYRLDDNEELIEMTLPAEMLFFGSIAPTQEFNRDRYERKITANRMNGAKGGAPVGNQNARKHENITQNNPNQHKGIVTEKGKVYFFDDIVCLISFMKEHGNIKKKIKAKPTGPSDEQRLKSKSLVWGEATNLAGEKVTASLSCLDGYSLTAHSSLLIVQKILMGNFKIGYQTPALVYGENLIFELPKTHKLS